MAERYSLQIGERKMPNALEQYHPVRPVPDAGIGAALGGLGRGVNELASVALRKQEETDMFRIEEANNELTKRLLDYTNNPDTGIFHARKLGGAINENSVTAEFEVRSKEIMEGVAKEYKLNSRQVQSFRRVALGTAMPFYKQTQNYEAAQGGAYKKAQTAANIDVNTQMILTAPLDADVFDAGWSRIAAGIELEMDGAPDEAVEAALSEARSGLRAAAIGQVAAEDPITANEMLKEYGGELRAEAKAKLTESLRPEVERIQVQETVDALVEKFGADNEAKVLKEIRANYSGRMEDAVASAYRTRVNELTIKKAQGEASLYKIQSENYDALMMDFYRNGAIPERAALDKMLDSGQINVKQYASAIGMDDFLVSRARTESFLRENEPGFNDLTPQQQDEKVRRRMGVTREREDEVYEALKVKVMAGDATETEVNGWFNNGDLSPERKDSLINAIKSIPKEQAAFVKQQTAALKLDIEKLQLKGDLSTAVYKSLAAQYLADEVEALGPNPPKKDVVAARRNAIVKIIEEAGEEERRINWGGKTELTPFGRRAHDIQNAINIERDNTSEYVPEFYGQSVRREGPLGGGGAPEPALQESAAPQLNDILFGDED